MLTTRKALLIMIALWSIAGCASQAASNSTAPATAAEMSQATVAATLPTAGPTAGGINQSSQTPQIPIATQSQTPDTPPAIASLTNTPQAGQTSPSATPTLTATPTPAAPPVNEDWPCQLGPTRTPPSGNAVDPHIEVCLTATTIQLGQQVSIYARTFWLGQPQYRIYSTDVDDPQAITEAYFNWGWFKLDIKSEGSRVIRIVGADSNSWDYVIFTLEGIAAGQVEVWITASGYDSTANNASADTFAVTVTE